MTIELIEALKADGVTVKADGDFLELSPLEKVTAELIQRLRKHKPEILAELKREQRREKVLAMLADKPESQRAIITDLDSDPDNAILTIAVRDVATCEMTIPKRMYDGLALLEMIHTMDDIEDVTH